MSPTERADTAHERRVEFPLGAAVTLAQLDADPHAVHARLRDAEPVSWLPCLNGWLITRHELALAAMRNAVTFTVDDPRFSTAQVIGPSMLSLDGERHRRHREPFVAPFRAAAVTERFEAAATAQARRLVDGLAPAGAGELRRGFAGPMAAAIVARALGLAADEVADVLGWYDAIVASVTEISAGNGATDAGDDAYAQLRARLQRVIDGDASGGTEASADGSPQPRLQRVIDGAASDATAARAGGSLLWAAAGGAGGLTDDEVASDAAVLLFGGIETTEGMIANATLALLRRPELVTVAREDPALLDGVIDESLRLEPAAAVIDRYATTDVIFGEAQIRRGELVRISIAGANRDPAVFDAPDRFDCNRPNLRRHLAFAQGPHVCVGVHLARLEARAALGALLGGLPGLALDAERPANVRGLVFRKPVTLWARWERR